MFYLEISVRNNGVKDHYRLEFSQKEMTKILTEGIEPLTIYVVGKGEKAYVTLDCDDVSEAQGIFVLNSEPYGSPIIYRNSGKGIVNIVNHENCYIKTISGNGEHELRVGEHLIFDGVRNKDESNCEIKIKCIYTPD